MTSFDRLHYAVASQAPINHYPILREVALKRRKFMYPSAITQIHSGHVQQLADIREHLTALFVRLLIGVVSQSGYSDY